jgi:hypothetical protein
MRIEGNSLTIAARGLAAGLVGTACMTALQEVMARRRRRARVAAGEPMADADPWEHAPAPAKLARLVIERAFHREVPAERIPFFTNAVHWGFGAQMGIAYAVLQTLGRGNPALRGPLFGLGVWAQSYATLVPLGLYRWPWHYRAGAIAKDVSYHLLYGSGVAAGYRLVTRGK